MTALEIVLSVVLLIVLAGAGVSAWIGIGWLRDAQREARYERHRREREHAKLLAAREKAAHAFAEVLELETEQANAPRYVGVAVNGISSSSSSSSRNPAIAAIVEDLQELSGKLQHASCESARGAFAAQKAEVLSRLSKAALSCDDVATAVNAATDMAKQTLVEQLRVPAADAAVIVSDLTDIWRRVASQVCDKKGAVDEGMLDAFMDAAFDAVCKGVPAPARAPDPRRTHHG
jgi:NAD-dependent SIR2 family protein deacetylase